MLGRERGQREPPCMIPYAPLWRVRHLAQLSSS
jgi:hypothetical protein